LARLPIAAMLAAFLVVAEGSAAAQARIRAPYLDIVWNYYDGNYQQAIDEIAAWPVDNLRERAFKDLDEAVIAAQGVPSMTFLSDGQRLGVTKIWATLTPVAALLHVEAGYHLLEKGQDKAGFRHLLMARLLADWTRWRFILEYLPAEQKNLDYTQFRRDVYLAIAWILQSAAERVTLNEHLLLARKNLPDEATIWLASGSAEELFAEPSMVKTLESTNRRIPRDTWELTMRERYLAKAEEYHREAIARDPALAEAHVRLGRVLQQRGKLSDARAALETARRLTSASGSAPASESAPAAASASAPASASASASGPASTFELESTSVVGYLATLFLAGVVDEADKQTTAAAFDLYTELVERWPECQSGHLGLSRMYSARGNGPAAFDALKPLWKEPERRACFDAWWVYRSGQAWRLKAALQAFRERVVS
jgi:tetratricopeptide (TPR) repeat protein